MASQPLPSAGIGRKVAESLQLFKESAPVGSLRPIIPTMSQRPSTNSSSAQIGLIPKRLLFGESVVRPP
ncbi:hypothetical protein SCLCIDRAFT_1209996 [Scleroderma citrinum Foug A]|uniref:Uncharacterized protein n=1 Tax=Scleroderma citrinum Foug A TaxID=1036808 RepID=A0A0C3EIW0_9AGAM|nr:hypothetical protein SCLCIDRAFT_1209996 [Scleroderma citrinum Foug A]